MYLILNFGRRHPMVTRLSLVMWLTTMLLVLGNALAAATTPGQTLGHAFDAGAVISYAIGTLLPFLVALVTKESEPASLKLILLALLSGVSSVLTQWLDAIHANIHFAWQSVVVTAIFTFITAVLTHITPWGAATVSGVQVTKGRVDRPHQHPGLEHTSVSQKQGSGYSER